MFLTVALSVDGWKQSNTKMKDKLELRFGDHQFIIVRPGASLGMFFQDKGHPKANKIQADTGRRGTRANKRGWTTPPHHSTCSHKSSPTAILTSTIICGIFVIPACLAKSKRTEYLDFFFLDICTRTDACDSLAVPAPLFFPQRGFCYSRLRPAGIAKNRCAKLRIISRLYIRLILR